MYYSKQLKKSIESLKSGKTSYLKDIFCVFTESSAEHKLLASKALAEHLAALSPDGIWRAERQMRSASSVEWLIDWRKKRVSSFLLPQMSAEEELAVLAFASFCSCGYIREEAVHMLKEREGSLPFLALRLSDWVSEVRTSAEKAFSARLPEAGHEELAAAFSLLDRSRGSLRADLEKINKDVEKRLSGDKALVCASLASRNLRTRKFCIFLLCKNAEEYRGLLLAHLKRESDPFLRKAIYSALLRAGTQDTELIALMLEDKYPANRILAITRSHSQGQIYRMLFDPCASVRSFARYAIAEREPETDFVGIYKNALSERTKYAILGIGDIGAPADTAEIAPYLESPHVSICRAAAISLMRLDAEKYAPDIAEKLLCENAGVFSSCAKLLKKYGVPDFGRINEIFLETKNEQAKLKCLSLLFLAPKWKRLIYILTYRRSENPAVKSACEYALGLWFDFFNRSYTLAASEEKAAIRALIAEEDEDFRNKVEFFIGA